MRDFLQRHAAWWPPLVALLVVIFPVFGHLDAQPIHMWDESRLANNALEMALGMNPHPLVTTFGGAPEMWNTKPPLLIWMQATAIRAFGPGEISVRLPSALAAVCTAWLLYRFGARRLGRPWLGTVAVAVLMTSMGYVSIHGIRTGDYDAMLTFFTTAYGLAWWAYLEEPKKKKWFYLAVLGLTGAAMTKGVAGLLATPALLMYTLYRRQLLRVLSSPHTYVGIALFLGVMAAYYVGRDRVNPGYIDAVLANEFGRYGETIEGHVHGWDMYFTSLLYPRFTHWAGWWIVGGIIALWQRDLVLRRANVFAVLFCIVHLLVISSAGTRIEWYDLPIFPYAALTAASGLHLLARWLRRAAASGALFTIVNEPVGASKSAHDEPTSLRTPSWLVPALTLAFFVAPFFAVYDYVANHRSHPWDNFENTTMATRLSRTVSGQMQPAADVYVWTDYQANLDYYFTAMRYRGISTVRVGNLDSVQIGQTIAVWQPEMRQAVEARFVVDTLEKFMDRTRVYRIKAEK